jgi:hypothetical protein
MVDYLNNFSTNNFNTGGFNLNSYSNPMNGLNPPNNDINTQMKAINAINKNSYSLKPLVNRNPQLYGSPANSQKKKKSIIDNSSETLSFSGSSKSLITKGTKNYSSDGESDRDSDEESDNDSSDEESDNDSSDDSSDDSSNEDSDEDSYDSSDESSSGSSLKKTISDHVTKNNFKTSVKNKLREGTTGKSSGSKSSHKSHKSHKSNDSNTKVNRSSGKKEVSTRKENQQTKPKTESNSNSNSNSKSIEAKKESTKKNISKKLKKRVNDADADANADEAEAVPTIIDERIKTLFRRHLEEFVDADNKIKELAKESKKFKDKKKEQEMKLLSIITKLELDKNIFTAPGGSYIRKSVHQTKQPLKPDMIKTTLLEVKKDEAWADNILAKIMEKRKVVPRTYLKRTNRKEDAMKE